MISITLFFVVVFLPIFPEMERKYHSGGKFHSFFFIKIQDVSSQTHFTEQENTVSSSSDACPTFPQTNTCAGAAAAAVMSTSQAEVNTRCQANLEREAPTFESRLDQL